MGNKSILIILFSGLLLLACACSDDSGAQSVETDASPGVTHDLPEDHNDGLGENDTIEVPENKALEIEIPQNARLVTAEDGLRMRDKPNLDGEVLCVIPCEDSVLVLEEQEAEMTIGGKTGVWSLVQWNEQTGWVFGGFLTESITDTITVNGEDIEVELYKGTREELLRVFDCDQSDNCKYYLGRGHERIYFNCNFNRREKNKYSIIRDAGGVSEHEYGELIFETNNTFTIIPELDRKLYSYMSDHEIYKYVTKKTTFQVWIKKNDPYLIIFHSDKLTLINKKRKNVKVGKYEGKDFEKVLEELSEDGVPYGFRVDKPADKGAKGGVITMQWPDPTSSLEEYRYLSLVLIKPDNIPEGKVFGFFEARLPKYIVYKKVEVIAVSGEERTTLMSMPHPGGELSIPYILDDNAEIIVLVDGEQRIKEKVKAY